MTCKEFQSRSGLSSREPAAAGSDELSEHIRTCTDCRCFTETQLELGRHLRLVRDSVAEVPSSLDAAILTHYRQYRTEQTALRSPLSFRQRVARLAVSWRWAVAAGALALLILSVAGVRSFKPIPPPSAIKALTSPSSSVPGTTKSAIAKTTPNPLNRASRHARHQHASVSIAGTSLPAGFTSLMYCDQLSCADAMQVIRVQLPDSFAGATRAPATADGAVLADVLVGSDGVARGIRIVE